MNYYLGKHQKSVDRTYRIALGPLRKRVADLITCMLQTGIYSHIYLHLRHGWPCFSKLTVLNFAVLILTARFSILCVLTVQLLAMCRFRLFRFWQLIIFKSYVFHDNASFFHTDSQRWYSWRLTAQQVEGVSSLRPTMRQRTTCDHTPRFFIDTVPYVICSRMQSIINMKKFYWFCWGSCWHDLTF